MEPSGLLIDPPEMEIAGMQPGEVLEDVVMRGVAAAEMAQCRLPLRDKGGNLVAPPESHVADFLARSLALDDENWIIEHSPIAAATVEVASVLQDCHICGRPERARYYGPFLDAVHGRGFVYMCRDCVANAEEPYLGSGGCVYVLTSEEVPDSLAKRVDDRLRQLGRPGHFGR